MQQTPPPPPGEAAETPEEYTPTEEMQVSAISKEEEIPVPSPSEAGPEAPAEAPVPSAAMPSMPSPQTMGFDEMQSVVEEIIDEKWRELLTSIGDITTWKSQISDDLEATKQELLRLQQRFDTVQAALTGKVSDYESAMKGLSGEMKAMEKVFEKILEPLTANIKELGRITQELRERKKR
jgi:hypothetical protein